MLRGKLYDIQTGGWLCHFQICRFPRSLLINSRTEPYKTSFAIQKLHPGNNRKTDHQPASPRLTTEFCQIGYRSNCKIHFCVVVVVQWLIFHDSVVIVHVGLLILEVSRSNSSQRVIGPSRIPLPNNTQHPQETDIHAPGGIRTSNLSKQAGSKPTT